jgi:hypothetical protein
MGSAQKLLMAYNCAECWSPKHRTGAYVTCPNCGYVDESNLGTKYDYLYGGEFLDYGCGNCGVRLQATFKLSVAWVTHEVYPQEIANKFRHERYLNGDFVWDYEEQLQ